MCDIAFLRITKFAAGSLAATGSGQRLKRKGGGGNYPTTPSTTRSAADHTEREMKWAMECEDRIDAVDRGDLPVIDDPSAMARIRQWLGD